MSQLTGHDSVCIMCLHTWLGYHHSRHSHSKILIEWIFPTPGALEHLFYLSLGGNHVSTRFEATNRACLLMFDVFFESTKYIKKKKAQILSVKPTFLSNRIHLSWQRQMAPSPPALRQVPCQIDRGNLERCGWKMNFQQFHLFGRSGNIT